MHTHDLLSAMKPAALELSAARCGIPASTPLLVAELLRTPAHAVRACRRAADAGGGRLVRTLVEFGGTRLPWHDNLRVESRLVADWFPMQASADGWTLPVDLAAAAIEFAEHERLFAATLLARCPDAEIRRATVEAGMVVFGSRAARIARLAVRVGATPPPAGIEDAIRATAGLPSIAVEDLTAVHAVAGSAGGVFEVTLKSGARLTVAAREWAIRAGHAFAPPAFGPTVIPQRRLMKVRLPTWTPSPVLVTFSTLRATEDAVSIEDFRSIVHQRLDERRVILRPGIDVRTVQSLLSRLGFALADASLTHGAY
jgi:hypothetical protein